MNDDDILTRIEELVAEEHRLLDRGGRTQGLGPEDHARLAEIKVQLDRAWDLLRQRRAHEEFDLDPDEASPRSTDVVEGYEQ